MHKTLMLAGIALCLAFIANAQDLNGARITVKTGDAAAGLVPVAVEWSGPAPETSVEVVPEGGGDALPATVREGQLVFVASGLKPNAEQAYTVRVAGEKRKPRVEIKPKEGEDDVLQVLIDGELFTEYHYGVDKPVTYEQAKAKQPDLSEDDFKALDANGDGRLTGADAPALKDGDLKKQIAAFVNRKPFLWPLNAEGGVTLTRDWPMAAGGKSMDHEHQKSFWTAHGAVNGADLWSETYQNSGYEMVDEVTHGSGDAYGWIRSKQTWQDKEHKPVITEVREYRFYAAPPADRTFDIDITFTADYGDALFGDTKEGGIVAFRIRPEIQEKGGTGLITTAVGTGAKDTWGKPSPWSDYSGDLPGYGPRGIAILDHPSNPLHPVRWHIRDYGLNGANYFGLHDFEPDSGKSGDWTIPSGQSKTFKYRVHVHSGTAEDVKVADRFAAYANPPIGAVAAR